MICEKCGAQIADGSTMCPYCMQSVSGSPMTEYKQPEYPMKWYKFLIYFSLFAGAVLNALNGLNAFRGSSYAELGGADFVYGLFPALESVDTLYGIALIAMAVFAIIVRNALKNFSASGPKLLYVYYIAGAVIVLVYNMMVCNAVSESIANVMPELVGNLIGTGIVLVCNYIYFNKRDSLFVN